MFDSRVYPLPAHVTLLGGGHWLTVTKRPSYHHAQREEEEEEEEIY
jgi:hypothetical protein